MSLHLGLVCTNHYMSNAMSTERLSVCCRVVNTSLMVSVAVSKLGKTDLVFVQPE